MNERTFNYLFLATIQFQVVGEVSILLRRKMCAKCTYYKPKATIFQYIFIFQA